MLGRDPRWSQGPWFTNCPLFWALKVWAAPRLLALRGFSGPSLTGFSCWAWETPMEGLPPMRPSVGDIFWSFWTPPRSLVSSWPVTWPRTQGPLVSKAGPPASAWRSFLGWGWGAVHSTHQLLVGKVDVGRCSEEPPSTRLSGLLTFQGCGNPGGR